MFRQRLRTHHRDLEVQLATLERGTAPWFDCERAMHATERLYVRLYREAIRKVHEQPPYREA